jgi:rhodanese-related sulfurtransferase
MNIDTKALQHPVAFEALCDDAKCRIREITVDDLAALQSGDEAFYLIDVRDRDEFESYHIEGAVFLSKGWAEAKIHTVAADMQDKIVLYCGGGNRSALVADNLQRMGYTDVLSVAGGIKSWVNAGKPVLRT